MGIDVFSGFRTTMMLTLALPTCKIASWESVAGRNSVVAPVAAQNVVVHADQARCASHPGVPCVAFCTGCSCNWRAWLCVRDARRTLRSSSFAACGCRKLRRGWSGSNPVLVGDSVTAGRFEDLEVPIWLVCSGRSIAAGSRRRTGPSSRCCRVRSTGRVSDR